ncbi:MAG: hypothetical protein AAFP76_05260 [Bacteroidota bacterium]
MKTNLIHSILTVLVVLSLFVPAVIPFIEVNEDAIVLLDITEEEQKKESKKELEEKVVYFQDLLNTFGSIDASEKKNSFHYSESLLEIHSEIHLPPPELNS